MNYVVADLANLWSVLRVLSRFQLTNWTNRTILIFPLLRFYLGISFPLNDRVLFQNEIKRRAIQGWAGMTFGSSGTGTGMDNSIPEVREREGNWKNPFPQFGNGKGMKKKHSQNSGMGREWKNLFPKFGNGKGMKKIHSHNSGTGREWKKSIPTIREWESEAIIPKNSREREREWKNITRQ